VEVLFALRSQDKLVFAACAVAHRYWILVRRTNPKSLAWIGLPGFIPKPIDCKPKTADYGPRAGLVVNPLAARDVFSEAKLHEAMTCWEEFQPILRDNSRGYSVDTDPKSDWYGCVLLNGARIHGDYDLYDVIDPPHARRNFAIVDTLHGQLHMRSPYLYRVMDWLNARLGARLVQHSGEAQYKDHSDQTLDAFGPSGEFRALHNEAETRLFYTTQFEGRKALGKNVRW
jgi:hypothetical protein